MIHFEYSVFYPLAQRGFYNDTIKVSLNCLLSESFSLSIAKSFMNFFNSLGKLRKISNLTLLTCIKNGDTIGKVKEQKVFIDVSIEKVSLNYILSDTFLDHICIYPVLQAYREQKQRSMNKASRGKTITYFIIYSTRHQFKKFWTLGITKFFCHP